MVFVEWLLAMLLGGLIGALALWFVQGFRDTPRLVQMDREASQTRIRELEALLAEAERSDASPEDEVPTAFGSFSVAALPRDVVGYVQISDFRRTNAGRLWIPLKSVLSSQRVTTSIRVWKVPSSAAGPALRRFRAIRGTWVLMTSEVSRQLDVQVAEFTSARGVMVVPVEFPELPVDDPTVPAGRRLTY